MMFAVQPEDATWERPDSYKLITVNIAYAHSQQHLFFYCLSKMTSMSQNFFNIAKIFVNVSIQAHQS